MTKVNVHTRKFYRVVLEGIDPNKETPATFALKLSLRLSITLPRSKQFVKNAPCRIKGNISASEANKLKAILEEIGGQCRLESHFVTFGEEPPQVKPVEKWSERWNEKPV
jgi:hypothetical protein